MMNINYRDFETKLTHMIVDNFCDAGSSFSARFSADRYHFGFKKIGGFIVPSDICDAPYPSFEDGFTLDVSFKTRKLPLSLSKVFMTLDAKDGAMRVTVCFGSKRKIAEDSALLVGAVDEWCVHEEELAKNRAVLLRDFSFDGLDSLCETLSTLFDSLVTDHMGDYLEYLQQGESYDDLEDYN